jgi:hypothetical protein
VPVATLRRKELVVSRRHHSFLFGDSHRKRRKRRKRRRKQEKQINHALRDLNDSIAQLSLRVEHSDAARKIPVEAGKE